MSRIFITGDTHHDVDIDKLSSKKFQHTTGIQEDRLTRDDYLIICGDFGLIWYSDKQKEKEDYLLKWWNKKPYTVLFIDGNHENFDRLEKFPVQDWHGGKVHMISDSIIHLMRGQVFEIAGNTFFTMGGATSIDRAFRTNHISWWERELPSSEEYEIAMKNLQNHNMSVDYVITHCCASTYQGDILNHVNDIVRDDLNEFFRKIEFDDKLEFRHWYFGHYHVDKQLDDKHTGLYNRIVQIK